VFVVRPRQSVTDLGARRRPDRVDARHRGVRQQQQLHEAHLVLPEVLEAVLREVPRAQTRVLRDASVVEVQKLQPADAQPGHLRYREEGLGRGTA